MRKRLRKKLEKARQLQDGLTVDQLATASRIMSRAGTSLSDVAKNVRAFGAALRHLRKEPEHVEPT